MSILNTEANPITDSIVKRSNKKHSEIEDEFLRQSNI